MHNKYSGNSPKKIFFFGELPPRTITGVSISNKINIDILKRKFDLDCVEEFSALEYHERFSFHKVKEFLKSLFISWYLFARKKYCFYYGVIYLSQLGIVKNLILVGVFKLLNYDSKVILHFHRSDLESFFHKSLVNRILFKLLDAMVEKYIVLANRQKVDISKYTSNEICVLHNTIDESSLKVETKDKQQGQRIKILFLSNFIVEKGFLDVIKAQIKINKTFPNTFELNCYGSFSNSNERTKIDIKDLKNHNITINDRVYGEYKNKVLNDADVIVLPSYNEGLPLILLESLYFKKPIVLTRVGYIDEILGEGYPLYCNVKDSDSIVESILTFKSKYNNEFFFDSLGALYSDLSIERHEEKLNLIFKV